MDIMKYDDLFHNKWFFLLKNNFFSDFLVKIWTFGHKTTMHTFARPKTILYDT